MITRRLIEAHGRAPRFSPATKTGMPAVLSIDAYTARLLADHLQRQDDERQRLGERYVDFGLVFCCEGGTPLSHRNVARDLPECFVLTPEEVRALAHKGEKDGKISYWLQPKQYETAQFHDKWDRNNPYSGTSRLSSGKRQPGTAMKSWCSL